MKELLDSYINGNISHVKHRLIDDPYSFGELLDMYKELILVCQRHNKAKHFYITILRRKR